MAVPCLRKLTITGLDCACGHKAFPDPFAKERHLKSAFEAQQERYKVSVPNITAYRTLPDVLQIKGLTHLRLRNIYLSDPKWKSAKRECRIHKLDIGCCFPSSYFTNQGAANRIMELFEIELEELTLEALPTQRPVPLGRPRKIPLINLQKLHLDALMPAQDRLHTLYYLSGSPIRKLTISCVKTDIHLVREVLRDFHLRYPRLYPYLKKIIFQVVERKGHVRVVRPPFPICIARQAAGCRSIWKQLDAILAGLHYDSSGAWTLHCPSVRPSYDY